MKKMTVALLGFVLGLTFVGQVKAQNFVGRYDSYNQGAVNYSLNSSGAQYGQLANDSTGFYLGVGSTQGTLGTAVILWNGSLQAAVGTSLPATTSRFEVGSTAAVRVKKNGWMEFYYQQVPTISSCGTSPSAATGTDQAGDVSIGSSPSNSCTVTFAETPTNIPHCVCSDRTTAVGCVAQATISTVVLKGTGGTLAAADAVDWICFGNQ